jgi:hypothetical protein
MRLALVALMLLSRAAAAAPTVAYDLDVSVDVDARQLDGRAHITVTNPTRQPLDELWLWRYPERFASRSPALNDFNFYWVYPRSFNPASMRVDSLSVGGRPAAVEVHDHPEAGPGTLLRVALPTPVPPGAKVRVDVAWESHLPERYGSYGCFRKTCTMVGFYPMVPALGREGFDLSAPPQTADFTVTVGVPRVSDVVVNGELRAVERGGQQRFVVGRARGAALIVGAPALRTYETTYRGVRIVYHSGSFKAVPTPPQHLLPYLPADRAAHVLSTVREWLDMLTEEGLPLPRREIRLVEGALRVELAQAQPGFVFLSDQIYEIFPLKKFLKFHDFELVRALSAYLVEQRILDSEKLDDLGWAAEVSAAALTDRFTVRSYRREEYAGQILSGAAWIPAIDRVLYAPQVPFAGAYFYSLEDPDPLRDNLNQFDNKRPRGKLIYAKLRDLLGDKPIENLVRGQFAGRDLRALAEDLAGKPLDWFFAQWLRPYPKVDYRFREIRSERAPQGTGWRHYVTVEKLGAAPPVEPVEVRIRDATGKSQLQTWDGHGDSAELVFDMAGPISLVEIDPRGRLYEDLPGSNDDLKFDDRRPPRWKFIYNNFGGLVTVFPSFALDLSLDFSLQRILDLKNALRFLIYTTAASYVGVSASYTRLWGRKITAASLSSHATFGISAARLNPDFGKDVGAGNIQGTAVGAGVSIGYDDRLFAWDPWRALSLGASLSGTLTILDNSTVLSQVSASAGYSQIVKLTDGHGFAVSLGAAGTFGDLRIQRQLLQMGGSGGLRGYDVATLPTRMRVIARMEYRHTFVRSLDWNLAHTIYMRGIGGAFFVEGGVMSGCDGYGIGPQDRAADVGYSLRLFGDWLGVSQTTFDIDVAVPLVGSTRDCFGTTIVNKAIYEVQKGDKVPLGFYFAFSPPW